MQRITRAASVLMVVAMVLAVIAACAAPAAAPAGPAPEQPAAQAPAGETIKIDMWHIQTTGAGPELIQTSVDRFMQDNPNVDVEVVPLQNDPYKTKIKVAMGAGNPPCIFPTWGGGPLFEYVNAGQVVDLTSYMEADNYKDRFVPASFSNVTFNDKIWGLPVENSAIAVIWYNKAIFAEYGLQPPQTWDELLQIMDTLNANGVAPFSMANKTKWPSSMFYMYLVDRLAGPSVFAAAATRTGGSFEDPTFVKAGELVQELVERNGFVAGFNGLDYDTGQSRQLLYSGKAAMELMGTWQIPAMLGENADFVANNLDFFPFPAVTDGQGDPSNVVGTVGDNYYSISSACAAPDEAFRLMQYLIDDEAVQARGADGRIPPVKGFTTEDPTSQRIIDLIGNAQSVQLWYDQYLPPELGEVHKDTMQALFGMEVTPEQAATQHEEAAVKFFGK
ncbi:MAG: extracellular solute-binding protein [Caldilineaceae bacterium]|nr:extracellular solute-binding protein [Caldilineaceae bacterium]